jgi:2-aminoadipate transaminase
MTILNSNSTHSPLTPALARRARSFEVSPWSAAADLVAQHHDPIYFGSGAPAREAQPIARLQIAGADAWADAEGALDYGEVEGYRPLRELIAARMGARGTVVDPDEIMITSGSQQGIDMVARVMFDPGDLVVIEGPAYIGAMQTFDAYEVAYLVAPVDDEGLDVGALAYRLDQTNVKPKLIYTVPTFQNPTGITMSLARREALLRLARERGILILEDDPYSDIYFEEPPLPSLRSLDPDVVYLGTFSKTIAPGIRVGWTVAPRSLLDLLLMAKEGSDIHTDRVITRTVYRAADGFLDDHIATLRDLYRARRDTLLDGLAQHLPNDLGVEWSCPGGGFFVWVRLPAGRDADELLPIAAKHGVAYLPGSWFYPPGQKDHTGLRLSFSSLPVDRIVEGTRRLGVAMREYLGEAEGGRRKAY